MFKIQFSAYNKKKLYERYLAFISGKTCLSKEEIEEIWEDPLKETVQKIDKTVRYLETNGKLTSSKTVELFLTSLGYLVAELGYPSYEELKAKEGKLRIAIDNFANSLGIKDLCELRDSNASNISSHNHSKLTDEDVQDAMIDMFLKGKNLTGLNVFFSDIILSSKYEKKQFSPRETLQLY